MSIKHHLDAATLMSFAAGSLPEALAAVAAAHIAVCPVCASECRDMDAIGAVLLSDCPPVPLVRSAPLMALRRAEAEVELGPTTSQHTSDVPALLAHLIGDSLDAIPWRPLGLGVWHHRLPTRSGDLRLLKVAAGRRMPDHGHGGSELTLMLRGAYTDSTGRYAVGDVSDMDTDIEHRPVADAFDGCICLIASEKPAKFKGLLPRIVQPLTGM